MTSRSVGLPLVIVAAAFTWHGFLVVAPRAQNAAPLTTTDVRGQWVGVGPSPVVNSQSPSGWYNSGRIGSIAIDPTNASHWLIGVSNGGVWESRDAGGSWLPLTDDQPTLATGDITFDPSDPNTIYVGSGDAKGGGVFKGGVGILKSTDGGHTWAVVGAASFARGAVKRIRVNPANPTELAAASSRGGFGRQLEDFPPSPPPYGILTSSDAGETWTRTLAGQTTALEIDPANFNHQYGAIGEQYDGQGAGVSPNGVYRSTDAGHHWDLIAGPWGSSSATTPPAFGPIELAMAPSNSNVVYASISQTITQGNGNPKLLGLYRTDNAWDDMPTWRQISTAQTDTGVGQTGMYCINCQSHVISVNPSDANMLFAGGKEELWRCSNCGSAPQWTGVITGATFQNHGDQRTAAWAGSRLIVGNDGGVYSTTNLGSTWQNHNASLPTLMFYSGALHPTDPTFMLGGLRDYSPAVRRNSSVWSFVQQASNSEWGEAEFAISSKHPDTDWMGGWIDGVFQRTIDGGKTILRVDGAIDKTGEAFVAPTRKCPANDDVFLIGTNRVWRTDSFFNSTMPSWSINGPSVAATSSGTIYEIAFFALDANCGTYAYGTSKGEIRLTQDGGKTWVDLDPAKRLPGRAIESIAFDPTTSDTMYAAISSFNAATSNKPGHIYKTTNASSASPSWVNVGPSDDVPFDAIAVDPRSPNLVYAGSDTGLWVSGDAGATWQKVGPDRGLPSAPIYDIKINPATNLTVVFTHGRSAYKLAQ